MAGYPIFTYHQNKSPYNPVGHYNYVTFFYHNLLQ